MHFADENLANKILCRYDIHVIMGVGHIILEILIGISGKSQVLFGMVFVTRYLDLFTNFVSPYNSVMKVIFILTTFATIYLVFVKFRATYDSNNDTFRAELLVIPTGGLAVLVNHEFTILEVCFV